MFNQLNDDLSIRFACKMHVRQILRLQFLKIADDAVVNEIKASIFRNVRMRIRFTRNSVRSPTRVSDAGSPLYVSRYFVL